MKLAARLERGFILVNQILLGLTLATVAGLVFTNVVTRYIFEFSIAWAEELSRFLMIWVTYLGAGLAMREGNHVAFEYIQTLAPARLVPVIRGIVAFGILAFLGVLTVVGWQFAQFTMRQQTAMLGIPRGVVGLAIPVGAVLFAIHLLLILRQYLTAPLTDDQEQAT